MRTIISGGRVVTSSGSFEADVLIDGETIDALGLFPDHEVDRRIDATGKLVLPGGVDPHTHLETPLKGTITIDDFYSGTVAAAIGGTTTIIDFPVQQRGDDPRVSHEDWYGRAEGKAVIDWSFHQIITDLPDKFFPAIDELVDVGCPSFKMFMAYPGARMVDDDVIFKAMRRSADNGAFVLMHCENGPVIDLLEREALGTKVLLDGLSAIDDHDRRRFEHLPHRLEAIAQPGRAEDEQREGPDRERRPGERHVALHHALLEQVGDHHDEDHVERLERRQLSPAENSEKQKDEHERGGRAQDDVHGSPQGKTVTVLVSSASPCAPSRSRTPCERRPTVVGST